MSIRILIAGMSFLAACAVLVGMTGCDQKVAEGAYTLKEKHIPFNHKAHVVGEEIKCDICHKTASKEATAGMPTFKSCNKCHESIDAKKKPERSIKNFLVDDKPVWSHITEFRTVAPDEIKFSHKVHVDAKMACTTCHKGVENATSITSKLRVTMRECIDCHAKTHVGENVRNNCTICHTNISKEWKPENHLVNWKLLHGREPGFVSKNTTAACEMCHTQSSCTKCHREEAPVSHTNYWRERGHAINADSDRSQCKVCHTEDSCLRCHQTITPQSHKGNYAAQHCLSCHFPLKDEGCIACHKNANSHFLADRLPNTQIHKKATDATCRDCHFGFKMLPHLDDGGSCLMCHKR